LDLVPDPTGLEASLTNVGESVGRLTLASISPALAPTIVLSLPGVWIMWLSACLLEASTIPAFDPGSSSGKRETMARLFTRDRRFSNFLEAALTVCLSDLTSFSESLYSLVAFCSLDLYDLESVYILVKPCIILRIDSPYAPSSRP
jgi:hypothetical protein